MQMDNYTCTLSITLIPIILLVLIVSFLNTAKKPPPKLPPGPTPWPIIGNILDLGDKPHQSLAELSKKHGPILSLKLGLTTTIVISSPDIAKQMFLKHDLEFSNRKFPDVVRVFNHYLYSLVWLPVGPKWRNLRKISVVQLFTNHKLDLSRSLRQEKVSELIEFVRDCFEKGGSIDIGKAGFTTSLNLLSNTLFSIDLVNHDTVKSDEFKELVWKILEIGASPNVSDCFPFLRGLDLQGMSKRCSGYFGKLFDVFDGIIEGRLKDGDCGKDDVLGTLLKLVDDGELSLVDVRHMLLNIFVAGTDTTSSTVEWAMTELLRNPDKMSKAQDELTQVITKNNSIVQESDISKLPYIQAVVKETFRLHPPTPFLLPHQAVNDVFFCRYLVPKNAQIWVNVWSIGRDAKVWPDPLSFSPERFLGSEIDFKGSDFELIPFGSGRRICPGLGLAHRMVHLMLANLLHSFNWKHAHGSSPEDIDMGEKFGITLQKVEPLQAIPLLR